MSSRTLQIIALAKKGKERRGKPDVAPSTCSQLLPHKTNFVDCELGDIPSGTDSCSSGSESESENEDHYLQLEQPSQVVEDDDHEPQPEESTSITEDGDGNVQCNDMAGDVPRFYETVIWEQYAIFNGVQDFTSDVGPQIPDSVGNPLEVFLQIFPKKLIEHISYHTNLYAAQRTGASTNFQHTNVEEIRLFLAINLMMGIKKMPSYKDYWSSNSALRDTYISSVMARNRFSWLLSNIHLNDNDQQPRKGQEEYDKLYKVRPLLVMLSESFRQSYKPSQKQSIDESMIKFKGRSALKQYMPLKPTKRGYKVWVRANENGYISQFQVYTGRVADTTEKNLGARVVKDLTASLQGKNHQVYFDNYFSSLPLFIYLLQHQVYACGTVRQGRVGMPKDFVSDKKMTRGEFQFRCSEDGIVALQWKDKKSILFLSNFHDIDDVSTVGRKNKDGSVMQIPCPQIVKDYNSNMGHVDKADMLKSLYEIDRKSKKWWLRIMWHFLDVAVVNSFLLFQERSESKSMSLKEFRLAIIAGIIGAKKSSPRGARASVKKQSFFKPYVPIEKRFDKAAHLPVRGTSRRCAFCSSAAQPHRTKWSCENCGVGLCMNDTKNCFAKYHKKD